LVFCHLGTGIESGARIHGTEYLIYRFITMQNVDTNLSPFPVMAFILSSSHPLPSHHSCYLITKWATTPINPATIR